MTRRVFHARANRKKETRWRPAPAINACVYACIRVRGVHARVCVRVGAQMDGRDRQPLSVLLSFSLALSACFQKDLSPEKYSITAPPGGLV